MKNFSKLISGVYRAGSNVFSQKMKLLAVAATSLFVASDGWSQANLAVGGTLTQNFNAVTAGSTTLPTGWKAATDNLPNGDRVIQTSYNSAGTTMGNTMSLTNCSGITGGGYALRNTISSGTGGTDYAVGFVGSGSIENGNVYLAITNNGASDIASFTISYSAEKYRNGNNAAGYQIQMLYATSPTATTTGWTALGSGFNATFASDGNLNCPNNTTPGNGANIPNATASIVNQVFTLPAPLTPTSTIYLVWNYSVVSGSTNTNAPQLGIDDVSITANGGAGSNHTVAFTGAATDFYSGEKFSAAANNTDYYITFDQNYLYLGAFRTSGTFGSSDNFAVYIDTDPRSTTTSGNGTTAGRNYNSVTPTLPFNADYTSYTEQSYTDPINRYNGSWASTGVTPTANTSTTAREVRIALSDIGNPSSVYITMWMGYSGGIFSNTPGTNVSPSGTPTIAGFFGSFPIYKSGINPTTYRTQNTSTANGGGTAISDLTLTSSGNIADDYGDITISNAAVGTVSVANASFSGSLTMSNTSTVALGTNTLNVGGRGIGGTAGQIVMNNTSATPIDGTTTVGKVAFLGAGLVSGSNTTRTFGTNSTVQIAGGVDFTGSATNINGILQINANGFVNTNVPTYGSASTLVYNTGGTYTAGTEWTANATSGTGVPANVTIGNGVNTTLSFGSSANYRAARGNVLVATSSGLTLSSTAGGDIYVGGNFTNSGTFTHSTRAAFFNGTGTQTLAGTLNGSGTTNFFPYLFVTNTTGNVTCGVNINVGTSGQSSFTVAASGGLYTQTAGTFTLVTGALGTVNGIFRNSGATALTFTGTMTVSGTGTYDHNINGGTIPTCTWSVGSTCLVTGVTSTDIAAGLGQSFSDFTWNSSQSGGRNLGGGLTSVGRDLNILGTGSQNLGLVASTGSLALSIGRDLNISGGFLVGTTGTVTPTVSIGRDLNISGTGALTIANSASTVAGTATVTVTGNTSITSSSGTALVIAASSSKSGLLTCNGTFSLNGSGQIHMSQATNATPNGTLTANGTITLTAGTLNVANTSASSVGIFNANAAMTINGATLNISTLGNGTVNQTGNLVFSSGTISRTSGTSTYNFSKASGTQTVNQTSGTFSGIIAVNAGTGATTNTVQLINDLNLGSGTGVFTTKLGTTLDFQTYTVTGSGTCASASGGTFKTASDYGFTASTTGSTGGSVQTTTRTYHSSGNYYFNGASAQGTGNFFGGTTPTANSAGVITIDNSSNVTLNATVSANTVNMSNGHLILGTNDITAGAISGAGSSRHFKTTSTGQLKQPVGTLFTNVLFPVGNTAYNPIMLNNSGGLSDVYGIRVIDAVTSPAPNDGTKLIDRYWAVTEVVSGTSTLTAAAQYNGGEENANFAAGSALKMGLHNGTTWTESAASSAGGGPYVVTNTSAFTPSTSSYTLGVGKDDGFAAPTTAYSWNGSTSSSWTTTTNWTPNGSPTISDNVRIDSTGTFALDLAATSQSCLKLTLSGTGTFSISGAGSLTVADSLVVSGGVAPTLACTSTLNLAFTGIQNIPAWDYGNLNASGGVRVLASSGTIGICGSYTPGSSTTVTGSTVDYKGSGAQSIAAANYNNLTISQNRGGAAITLASGTIDVAGTFNPSVSNFTVTTGTNTFNFSSASAQNFPAFFYYNVTNTGNGPRTWSNSGVIDINNAFTPGSGTHTITGSTMKYSSTSAATLSLVTFTTNITTPARQYYNLEIGGGASTIWQQTAGFNLGVANNFVYSGSGSYRVTAGATSNTMAVDGTLTHSGSGTLRVSGSATNGITGALTVTGNSTLNSGIMEIVGTAATTAHGAFTTNDLTIGGTGQLVLEVTAGTTGIATVTVNGDLYVTSTTANAINISASTNSASNQVALKGDFTKSGTGTLGLSGSTAGTSGYTFSGTGTQTFSHSGAAMTAGNFTVASGSAVQLLTNMTLGSGGNSALGVAGILDADVYQIISGNSSDQFTLNATGTLKTNSATGVAGTISSFTIFPAFSSGGTFEFTGTNVNTGFSGFSNISATYTLNWTGSGSLTLDKNISLTNFNFTNSGLVYLGAFNMTISSTGGISGGSFSSTKMIVTNGVGSLIRTISSPLSASVPFTWPIGDTLGVDEYSPVTISSTGFTNGIAGTIGFKVTDGVQSAMGAATNYLSRYWSYTTTGLGAYTWPNATFTYVAADIVTGPEASLKANIYDPNTFAWTELSTSSAGSNVLTITAGPYYTSAVNYNVITNADITGRVDVPIYYQTVGTGPASWATPATWEASASPAFTSPFTPVTPPSANNSALIRINTGHTVTVTSSTTADDLTINGTVDVSGATTVFTVNNGAAATDATIASTGTLVASTNSTSLVFNSGASTAVNGLLKIVGSTAASGASITNTGATINMNSGSTYEHARDGGTLTMGGTVNWNSGSTCRVTGLTLNVPTVGSWGQSFSNLTVHSNISSSLQLSGNLTTVNGNFRVTSTGSGALRLSSGTTYSLNVGGKMEIASGATLDVTSGAGLPTITVADSLIVAGTLDKTGGGNSTFQLNGDFYQPTGGVFNLTSVSTATVVNLKGNMTQNGTILRNNGTATWNFVKAASGTQTWTQSGGTVSGGFTFNIGNATTNTVQLLTNVNVGTSGVTTVAVASGATLDFQDKILSGTNAIFNMGSTATLKIGSQYGITNAAPGATSGNLQTLIAQRNVNATSTYVYNGSVNQVTGNLLPSTLTTTGKISIANTGTSGNNTVTLTTTGTTTPTLNLISGLFAAGTGQQLNITTGGNVVATGGDFATGSTAGVLNFPGTGTWSGTCNPYNVYTSGGVNFGSGTVTIQNNGTFRINNGGFVNTNAPFYHSNSTLQYNINLGGTYGRGLEWSAASGRGYPGNVKVSNNNTLDPSNANTNASVVLNCAGSLTIDAGSSMYMDLSGNNMLVDLNVLGSVNVNGNLSASGASGQDIYVGRDWTNNGTGTNFFPNSRAVFLNGTLTQTISGSNSSFPAFPYLLIDKSAGGVTLARDVEVSNTLTFTSGNVGIVDAASFTLYVSNNSTSAIVRTGSGHVMGNLRRAFNTGSNTYNFTVGDTTLYAPVAIAANSVTVAGSMTAFTTGGDHAQIASSGLDAAKSVNRTWTISQTGLTLTNYSPTFNFNNPADLDAGANTSNFIVGRYSGSTWSSPTVGTLTSTSTQATALTGYGAFAIAECKTPNSFTVSGSGSFCGSATIGLSGSNTWVTYQLQWNGNDVGSPVVGTGSALSFAGQTASGTYTVEAVNTLYPTCNATMSGSAVVLITPTVTPSVVINVSPSNTICSGTSVTFTATPTFGGPTPSYQWELNGANVGTNSPTYVNAGLANGDSLSVIMTADPSICPSPANDRSNYIYMNVISYATPLVSIAASPSSTICNGDLVTFTATPTFGGGTPSYQWKLNGSNVGTNSATYSSTTLANSDQVSCVMTSDYLCLLTPTATSNTVTMTVTAAPQVDAGTAMTTCGTTPFTFSNGATATNAASYSWTENGAGSITSGGSTLTPTYTPAAGDLGNTVTFTLTAVGNSPCGNVSDVVTLSVSALVLYYTDADGDGFGDPLSSPVAACSPPGGKVANNTDCCDSNADINPLCEWWADIDGDGYGSFIYTSGCVSGCSGAAQTIPYYPPAHGGLPYAPDCNDNSITIHPGAAELCQNNADDNCNGTIDEGCSGIVNDNYTSAVTINTLNPNTYYPNCLAYTGTIVNAAASSEGNPANVAAGGGRDIWYRFTAQSTGVQIKVVPNGFDAVIELRTAPHPATQTDVENLNTGTTPTTGLEIMNTNALTIGQVYYVGVRNYNNTNVGTFTLCVSPLMPSGCAYVEPAGGFALCANYKAVYRGATNYTFNFIGTGGTAPLVTTTGTSTGLIPMSTASLALRYGGEYNVRVDANYAQLYNGQNVLDPTITIQGNVATANCTAVSIISQPMVEVKLSQRCPAVLTRSTYLIATPVPGADNVCSATSYTYRFTQVASCGGAPAGIPFTVNTTSNTPYLSLISAFPAALANTGIWKVEVRPNFSYGSGSYGPAQYVQVSGSSLSGLAPGDGGMAEAERSFVQEIDAAIYPNPNNGEVLNLNLTNVSSDQVFVKITDATGRIVFSNRYTVIGSLNTTVVFEKALAGGLYLVEFVSEGNTITERLLIEK